MRLTQPRRMLALTQKEYRMSFQISGLSVEPFSRYFGLSDAELARHQIVRHKADHSPGFPCRVSLRDAEVGETLLLLNYEHLDVATPYRSQYAIYVREFADEAHPGVNEIPTVLKRRLLSLRAFDTEGMLLDADVADGSDIEPMIERMFGNARVGYIHVHNAKPGCFAARIDRA
jgi:hypothetical protein